MAAKAFEMVAGNDDFLVGEQARALYERHARAITDDFGREVLNGQVLRVDEVAAVVAQFRSAVATLPMFGDRKVVWLKDISFLADTVLGRSEETLAQVARLQEALAAVNPAEVAVVLSACPVDRRRREWKWFETHGECLVANAAADAEGLARLAALMEREAAAQGVSYALGAAEALLERIHGDARLALGETRKLALCLPPGETVITPEVVRANVPAFGGESVFQAVEDFFTLDLRKALDGLRAHFFAGHDARPLLTGLQNRLRLLIALRAMLDAGDLRPGGINKTSLERAAAKHGRPVDAKTPKSAFNIFSQNPWYLNNLSQVAEKRPLKRWVDCQFEAARAFDELISRYPDDEAVLRDLFVRCLGHA